MHSKLAIYTLDYFGENLKERLYKEKSLLSQYIVAFQRAMKYFLGKNFNMKIPFTPSIEVYSPKVTLVCVKLTKPNWHNNKYVSNKHAMYGFHCIFRYDRRPMSLAYLM